MSALGGGRIFPGVHHIADFDIREHGGNFRVAMRSLDGTASLVVDAELASDLPQESIFGSLDDVSRFFEAGSLGYSPSNISGTYDGLELSSFSWQVEPLAVKEIKSSVFNDQRTFPGGSVQFDNALLMRGIDHEWHGRESLCCAVG